jgi:hypothetical protein
MMLKILCYLSTVFLFYPPSQGLDNKTLVKDQSKIYEDEFQNLKGTWKFISEKVEGKVSSEKQLKFKAGENTAHFLFSFKKE